MLLPPVSSIVHCLYHLRLYLVDKQQRPHLLSLFMPFLYLQFLYIILNYREITLIKEPNDEPIYGTLPVIGCHISHDPVVAPSYPVPRCSTAPGLRLRIFGRSLKEVQEQLLLLSLAGQRHDGTGWNWMELDPVWTCFPELDTCTCVLKL
jgi:hypothetical protein